MAEGRSSTSVQLKSLLVAEARQNHAISRYSPNQIAPFQMKRLQKTFFWNVQEGTGNEYVDFVVRNSEYCKWDDSKNFH